VVKPNGDGSSFGVTIVQNAEALAGAVEEAFKYGSEILLETFIKGTEVTCGVIDVGDGLQVLPLVEIRPTESFFNFEAKYTASKCEEICPAEVSQEIAEQIQDASLEAFLVLGCRHYARADWILSEDGKPYFLEINTLPGMTKTSLIPQELAAAGISYTDFIDQLVTAAR
jgi:D-alanine-D-alanine ligase